MRKGDESDNEEDGPGPQLEVVDLRSPRGEAAEGTSGSGGEGATPGEGAAQPADAVFEAASIGTSEALNKRADAVSGNDVCGLCFSFIVLGILISDLLR